MCSIAWFFIAISGKAQTKTWVSLDNNPEDSPPSVLVLQDEDIKAYISQSYRDHNFECLLFIGNVGAIPTHEFAPVETYMTWAFTSDFWYTQYWEPSFAVPFVVGRIPAAQTWEAANMINKTIDLELNAHQAQDAWSEVTAAYFRMHEFNTPFASARTCKEMDDSLQIGCLTQASFDSDEPLLIKRRCRPPRLGGQDGHPRSDGCDFAVSFPCAAERRRS